LNGELIEVPAGWTLADLVHARCPSDRGVAVAVDLEVVPRSQWSAVAPADGSSVEIVTAAAGG
jgi:sulfur carrier protein